ncbi:MAG: glycosyltransferase [Aggregatilineales bacterium]
MRIGIVTGEYPPMQGGVGAYTNLLARHLADQGQQVHLFSRSGTRSANLPLEASVSAWGLSSLWAVRRWVKDNRLQIVCVQFQTAAFDMSPWVHFLPDTAGVPVVTTFHDLRFPYLFPKAGPLRDWIVMRLACASSGVIVTNDEDEIQVRHLPHTALIPIASNILAELPHPFDPTPWREQAGAGAGDFLLAHFGLVNYSKGLDVLLEALAVLRQMGVPARLVVIGGETGSSDPSNAAYAAKIAALVARLGLAPYTRFTGYLQDEVAVGSFLKASDMVVLPYRDGVSLRRGSLMAAVHYGCPITTTASRVEIVLFRDRHNMLLVPPNDSAALAQTLRRYYESPQLQSALRSEAENLKHLFEWPQIAASYIRFLERVLEAQR